MSPKTAFSIFLFAFIRPRSFLRMFNLIDIYRLPGHISLEDGLCLCEISNSMKDNSLVVEIGSYRGKSTGFILRGLKNNCELHCVDTWQNEGMSEGLTDTFQSFSENIGKIGAKIMPQIHRGYSWDVVKTWNRQIDFLFIDGNHDYEAVKKDIGDWLGFVKKGGVVAFHDYTNPCGVKKAVDKAVLKRLLKKVKISGSVYVAQKI